MRPERPQIRARPCPACGGDVDPIRAPRVLWLDDGVRFLCGDACRDRFLHGDRDHDLPHDDVQADPEQGDDGEERPSLPDLVREATHTHQGDEVPKRDRSEHARYDFWAAVALSCATVAFGAASERMQTGWVAGIFAIGAAWAIARNPLPTVGARRLVQWVAPVGLALAGLAAVSMPIESVSSWELMGLGGAALVLSLRHLLHDAILAPIETNALRLSRTLPTHVRVPSPASVPSTRPNEPTASFEEVPLSDVGPGELIGALEGELIGADGVVESGRAVGLHYPGAALSRTYEEGDFILAGTRVLEGALTIRVRRTGRERSVARTLSLGAHRGEAWSSAPFRLPWVLNYWSWAALLPLTMVAGVIGGLDAAGTFLLGVPVIAALGAFDTPLRAAALALVRRGMLFGSTKTLRDAGRVTSTAILLRGALSAGHPSVQQVHRFGRLDPDAVLRAAAAAERSAGDHPVAIAIRGYAAARHQGDDSVRRASVHPGLGVTAVDQDGSALVIGRRQMLLDEGISVAAADADAALIENAGLTPVFIAVDRQLEALVAVDDPTHVGAPDAVRRIAELPSEVLILSGDDRRTVERVAERLGAGQVKAPLLPGERIDEVRALRETGGIVAAVGRGGDDDDVLAAADVPISVRLVGSALEDRGVAIASQDIRDAAGALWIARATHRTTLRAVIAVFLAALVAFFGAVFGWTTPVTAALLSLAADAWALRAGSRLLRRVDLRVPVQE